MALEIAVNPGIKVPKILNMYKIKRPNIMAYTVATVQPGNCKYGKVAYGLHV